MPDKLTAEAVRQIAGLPVVRSSEQEVHTNILLYGDSGVGKTVLACSAAVVPEMSPVLLIDMEGGALSVRERYPDVDIVRVKTMQQMQDVYDALRSGHTGYRTFILDSLTEVQKFSMNQIMIKVKEEDPERDIEVPSMREYLKNLEQVRMLVRAFRDLPVHAIFTALEDWDKDEQSKKHNFMPLLTGKSQKEVPGFFDIVARMWVIDDPDREGEQLRLLQTVSTTKVRAKDRTGKLPAILGEVEPPTMELIYKLALDSPEPHTGE